MRHYILALCSALILGCSGQNTDPTAKDIAKALGMHTWKVQIPHSIPDSKTLALKSNFNGKEKVIAKLENKAGAIVTIIMWNRTDTPDELTTSIDYGDYSTSVKINYSAVDTFNSIMTFNNINKLCSTNDSLIEFNGKDIHSKVYLELIDK
jgi:hypothetical protein